VPSRRGLARFLVGLPIGLCAVAIGLLPATRAAQPGRVAFAISFPSSLEASALDGRLLLMLSTDASAELRFQIVDGPSTQVAFGIDVDGLAPGAEAVIDESVLGYPVDSLRDVPPGIYTVQALLHRYETFRRGDGHTVKLPMDRGEGQQRNLAPGNLYSSPRSITIPPKGGTIRVELDQAIPVIPDPPTTKYIRHERIRRQLLSDFWGRDMYVGAHVLVPEGFDDHPDARYPLMIFHGHFPYTFGGFREEPSDRDLKPDYRARFDVHGYNRIQQEAGIRVLPDVDRSRVPSRARDRDSAPDTVLRRLVRSELRQQRPVRRRDRPGTHPAHRTDVSRHR
jgi:hypothetical protein